MAEGPIARRARGQIPQSWDALASSSYYGEELLQSKVDFVKFYLDGTIYAVGDEQSVYNPFVQEYMAKLIAIQVIPAAVDYWSRKYTSEQRSGSNESRTYPDTISALWKINERLLTEVRDLQEVYDKYKGRVALKRAAPPRVSRTWPFRTPDPWLFQGLATTFDDPLGAFSVSTWH